ncbi:MAG: tetratricopeptide repeat protein, partial [Mangrovicoccus sp.]
MRRFIAVALSASVLLGTVSPLAAQIGNSGSYLAARQAGLSRDYSKAAEYFSRALSLDPRNQALMENALSAQASIGRFDRALPVARRMEQEGYANALAHLVFVVHEAQDGDFAAVLDRFDSGQSLGGLIDGLVAGWAAFGEGRVSDALAQFDMVAAERGLDQLGLYHKALALAVAGDYDSAVSILSGEAGVDMAVSQRGVVAFAQMLSQLDRNEDALALLLARFGDHPRYQGMIAQLEAGETIPFDIITSAGDGIAETFYSGAQIFLWQRENMRQADVSPSLIYAQ